MHAEKLLQAFLVLRFSTEVTETVQRILALIHYSVAKFNFGPLTMMQSCLVC